MKMNHIVAGMIMVMGAHVQAEEILPLMHRVNNYQIAHPKMKAEDRNWERGTWYTGIMAAYKATGDQVFLDQCLKWGEQHQWAVGTEKQGANKLFCVETWAELRLLKKERAMIEPALKHLNTPAYNSPVGLTGVWYLEGLRRYADSLYGACTLAMLTKATRDQRYVGWMHAFFWDVHNELFDRNDHLFYRDNRFIEQRTKNGKKIFWSRGNGWVIAGTVRVLEYLPESDPQRGRYVELLRQMSAAIAKRQRPDGFWSPNLGDSTEPDSPETSGTAFFCYAMAWGINYGVLDRETYLPVVDKAWAALVSSVTPEGRIQWGQLVGDRPVVLGKDDTHEYVTGTFLLAASEVFTLRK
jgi:rhamnogalacturonyl hydrolase YesR